MDDTTAHLAYQDVTAKEPAERRAAALRFQGAPWSQQDDFHAKESQAMRGFSLSHHVSLSSVVRALDQGMRERWPTSPGIEVSQKVVPCRPRLMY
jgi:hypothetical protein